MSDTTQHAFIEALVTLWTEAITVEWGDDAARPVKVHDGPSLIDDDAYVGLWVGHNPLDDDGTVVNSSQRPAQLGGQRREETGTVVCCIGAWSGDSTTTPRRKAVASVLSQAEALVRADLTVGQTVMWSDFGPTVELHQQLTEEGNEVLCVFTVDFTSRT